MGGRLAVGAGRPLWIYRFAVGSTFIMIGNDFFYDEEFAQGREKTGFSTFARLHRLAVVRQLIRDPSNVKAF